MWQTKYASAVPKNLGVGVDFRLFSKGDFLSGRLESVVVAITCLVKNDLVMMVHILQDITLGSKYF